MERWALIYENWFLGNLGAIIMHKGTSWVQVFNNHFIDNYSGIGVAPNVQSMVSMASFPPGDKRVLASSSVAPPSDFDSPLDSVWEVEATKILTTKHIYIYRNVIAANWNHGIELVEGVSCLVCDLRSHTPDGETEPEYEEPGGVAEKEGWTREPYGLSLVDVVIVHNTIDSNGGCWLKTEGVEGSRTRYFYGSGIVLTRETGESKDNLDTTRTAASTLGDSFLDLAIYNNILSNNYTLQIDLQDWAICEEIFVNLDYPDQPHNVIPRVEAGERVGIEEFVYYGLDYNAYLFEDAVGDATWMRDFRTWKESVVDGETVWVEEIVRDNNDVRVSTSSGDSRPTRWMADRDSGPIGRDYALELNAQIVSSYGELYDEAAYPELLKYVRDFELASHVRSRGHIPSEVAWYLRLVHEEPLAWRPQGGSVVRDMGAHGPGTFPDETPHAWSSSEEPIYESPDIADQPVVGSPDIGACECPPDR